MAEKIEITAFSAVPEIGKEMKKPILRNKKNKFGLVQRLIKIKQKREHKILKFILLTWPAFKWSLA